MAIVYLSSHEDAQETRRHVESEGRQCLLIAGDVKDPKFCQEAVEQTIAQFAGLDILVNNAAFQEHAHSWRTSRTSAWTRPSRPTSTATSTWRAPRCRT